MLYLRAELRVQCQSQFAVDPTEVSPSSARSGDSDFERHVQEAASWRAFVTIRWVVPFAQLCLEWHTRFSLSLTRRALSHYSRVSRLGSLEPGDKTGLRL